MAEMAPPRGGHRVVTIRDHWRTGIAPRKDNLIIRDAELSQLVAILMGTHLQLYLEEGRTDC
jgi:hypothetical protein